LENSLPLVKLGQADKWQPAQSSEECDQVNDLPESTKDHLSIHISDEAGEWNDALDRDSSPVQWKPDYLESEGNKRDDHFPPLFRILRRGLKNVLVSSGLSAAGPNETGRAQKSRRATDPRFLKWFIWVQILLGWLFVAGISGIIRK
jgi:hypothetical protein